MSTGIVTRRKSAMHIDNSYGIDVVAANTNLVSRRVLKGEPFNTQIVCDEGYSIYEITIKMGGVDITSTAYDATYNMISIASVTGDVNIECYAMHTMPSDYVRVDGIKNPSNAYLQTGHQVGINDKLEIKATIVKAERGYTFICANKSPSMSASYGRGSGWYIHSNGNLYCLTDYSNIAVYTNSSLFNNQTLVFIADYYNGKHTDIRNGVVTNKTFQKRGGNDSFTICIFSRNGGDDSAKTAGQIVYYFHIYDYSTTSYVRYYIPCLNDSGVAGFWDAARGVFQGSSNITAFQPVYVQDNLIAHYDGIDNAGVGVHDASATTWKDLKGNYDATTDSAITWDSNGFTNNSDRRLFKASKDIIQTISPVDFTIECVFKPTNITSGGSRPTLVSNYNGATNINRLHVNIRTDVLVVFNSSTSVQTPSGLLDNGNSYTVTIRRAGNTCAIFVNGVKATEKNIGYLRFTSNDEFYEIGSYFSTSYALKGTYYAHRVYTKALTDEEIKGNYNIDKLRFNF